MTQSRSNQGTDLIEDQGQTDFTTDREYICFCLKEVVTSYLDSPRSPVSGPKTSSNFNRNTPEAPRSC